MPAASVSCASGESAPSDMPPDLKRFTISAAGSTSSSGTGSGRLVEAQQAAQRRLRHGHLVHVGGEALVGVGAALVACGLLERGDRLRVPAVELAVAAPGVDAAGRQQLGARRRVGARVAVEALPGQHVHPHAADARGRAGEVAVHELLLDADRLEDLRAGVGADRRDPHLGEDLQEALADGLDVAAHRLVRRHALGQAALAMERVERLEHHVGVHGGGPVADQAGHVVDLLGLAGLDDQAASQARALADEVVVHRRGGEHRGHRDALGAEVAVGEDEDVHAAPDQLGGLVADLLEPLLHPLRALRGGPGHVDRARLEHAVVDLAELLELRASQQRLRHHELVAVVGRLAEQVDLRADHGLEAHHDRLADRVDGRVRDLREQLLEVGEQRRAHVGEDGEGGVVAHRPGGLDGVARHRHERHAQVLLGPAEGELLGAQRLHARDPRSLLGQVLDVHDALLEPAPVGAPLGELELDLAVGHHLVALEVDQEQLAGQEPALGGDLVGGHLEHAGLGGEDDPAVPRHEPAPGAQAVAVERRADHAAVAEGHGGRAVPGLDERGVVGVEVAHLLRQLRAALVGLRDQHRDRVGSRAAAEHEQLHQAVERGRVGDVVAQQRVDLLDVLAEEVGGELELPRAHPVAVAAQGVDLAVVGEHAVRVGELPAREGVRGEARVHERQAADHALVAQVGEVARQLGRGEHALEDHRAAGEARDGELVEVLVLDRAADHVELALEGVLVEVVRGAHEQLGDPRGHRARGRATRALVHRHLAPPQDALPLGLDAVLQEAHRLGRVA